MRWFSLFVLMVLFWAALSFQPKSALLVGSGIVTAGLVAWVTIRRELNIRDWSPINYALGLVFYLPWLLLQILLANLRVLRIIWHPRLPISPRMVKLPSELHSTTGGAVYANSITLTPGTVTIDFNHDYVLVHALTVEDAQGLLDGDLQDRVRQIEPKV